MSHQRGESTEKRTCFVPAKNVLHHLLSPQEMKKGGTLFSYFQPTSNGRGPKQSPKTPKAKAKKATSPASGKKARKGFGGGDTAVSSGLLVWAKMEGHPWWPAMVTPHSLGDSDRVLRGKKCLEAHVQFFGQPPTRGWVPVTNIESLTEATITHHQENEEGFVEAIKGAKEALGLSLKARLELVVDIPSEGEEEGGNQENVEPMEVSSSGRKRPCPLPGSDEDSDDEIGVRKVSQFVCVYVYTCVCVCVCCVNVCNSYRPRLADPKEQPLCPSKREHEQRSVSGELWTQKTQVT